MKTKTALALLAASCLAPVAAVAADPQDKPAPGSTEVSGIVVTTAQRREEQISAVPIAITAKTGTQLIDEGVNSTMDLGLVTPGLYYAQQGNSAEPTIRGVGTALTTPGADANVALYIDDIYQPNQTANNFQFNDVQDVEVLKGPQGTLFGRNSTGGTIAIKTFDPSWTPSAHIFGSYGSFNEVRISGYGNMPLSDTLAANVSVYADHDDGFMDNTFLNVSEAQAKVFAARGKVLWKPTDKISFVLGVNYSDANNNAPFTNRVKNGDSALSYPVFLAGLSFPTGRYQTAGAIVPVIETVSDGVNLHAKFQTDFGTFTSITSYEDYRVNIQTDVGFAPLFTSGIYIWDSESAITQEVNFASKQMGPFSFIAGAYYYDDKYHIDLFVKTSPSHVAIDETGQVTTQAESFFAEGNLDLTSQLRLIFGGRYQHESKNQSGCDALPAVATNANFPCAFAKYGPHTDSWDTFDPRAVLQYKLDPYSQVYFSFSVGDKSGNYNLGVTTPVKPESINAYEIGYKRDHDNLSFDIAAYYYQYKNIQVQTLTGQNAAVLTVLTNAQGATIYGLDGDFTDVINENWKVNLGAAWLHATYSSFPGATLTTPTFECVVGGMIVDPHNACSGAGMTFSTGNAQAPIDATGKNLIRAPQFMVDGTVTYDHPLPVGKFEASTTVSYTGKFWWDPYNEFEQPGYVIVDAKISWISDDNRYRLSLWGTNLAGAVYDVWDAPAGPGDTEVLGRPRAVGVSVDVKL